MKVTRAPLSKVEIQFQSAGIRHGVAEADREPIFHMNSRAYEPEHECLVCGRRSRHEIAFVKNGFQIVRCLSCGAGATLIGAEFSPTRIYTNGYFEGGQSDGYADYSHSEDILRAEFRKLLKEVGRIFPLSGRLVEVGSAYGYFLLEAQKYFEVRGFEVSETAANHARKRGLNTVCGEASEESLRDGGLIDMAVMLDVIEHLESPADVLLAIRNNMKAGAGLVISTGDWSSLYSRIAKSRWRLMTPPQHLFFFTPKSISELLRRTGFELVCISRPWKLVPLSLVLFQFLRLVGGKPLRAEFLSRVGVPVNLFDAMRVIARRV
jgi:SAM-dependent methyltransferase